MDTNVAVVANGQADQAGPECVAACVRALRQIQEARRLLLHDGYLIIEEYRDNLSASGQPGPGDAFFLWLWNNQANQRHCRTVPITEDPDRGFEQFPDDPRLASFDSSDRKFVAVALASGTNPTVLNASDTDWWRHRTELRRHGVEIDFLCPELMKA